MFIFAILRLKIIFENLFQILAALDNGSIELLTLSHNNEDPKKPYNFFERQKTIREHDDIITGMTLTADGSKVVTSSYDK